LHAPVATSVADPGADESFRHVGISTPTPQKQSVLAVARQFVERAQSRIARHCSRAVEFDKESHVTSSAGSASGVH
jgi:hypothetical protein